MREGRGSCVKKGRVGIRDRCSRGEKREKGHVREVRGVVREVHQGRMERDISKGEGSGESRRVRGTVTLDVRSDEGSEREGKAK